MINKLYTSRSEGDISWSDYPRPSLVRDRWMSLNGEWSFMAKSSRDKVYYSGKIRVPYCPESELSGVGEVFRQGRFIYKRSFMIPREWEGMRLLLHFGAVDAIARVYVNGTFTGEHRGGYTAFTYDITDVAEEFNDLEVRVIDELDRNYPYGKQRYERGGMWYTPVSGIWQSVWLEAVPKEYVRSIKQKTLEKGVKLYFEGGGDGSIKLESGEEYPVRDGHATVEPGELRMWSPKDPFLYRYSARIGEDEFSSYFAIRSIEIRQCGEYKRTSLNGGPVYFHALLDQGYYPEGIYTPPSSASFEDDIKTAKALGFNTLRKHVKVEPDVFYYLCDVYGMLVFQDMVNNGSYSYVFDTLAPTVGMKKRLKRLEKRDVKAGRIFLHEMDATATQLMFHPCIVMWTIFNEGWGQVRADDMYDHLRKLDSERLIDTTSGWFRENKSDIESYHVYFHRPWIKRTDKVCMISEFGGYAIKTEGHVFNDKSYGYKMYSDPESFSKGFFELYERDILPLIEKGVCCDVYTQLCDVEDEINGLVTYDRRVVKLPEDRAKELGRRLDERYLKVCEES